MRGKLSRAGQKAAARRPLAPGTDGRPGAPVPMPPLPGHPAACRTAGAGPAEVCREGAAASG